MSANSGYSERSGQHAAVAAVWSSFADEATSSLVAADGCFDVIVRRAPRSRAHVSIYVPSTAALPVQLGAGSRCFGVRFRPGYGGMLVERRAAVVAAVERVADDVDDADHLERALAPLIDEARPPLIVTDFATGAREVRGGLRLTASSTSAHQRELQRACQRWLGLAPKGFLRIERAWAARRAILTRAPLGAVAADLGYSDQAHLTRELRQLLGVTPRALRAVGNLQDPSWPRR